MADVANPTPRYAVITGAAGGIGRALVLAFEGAGYRVIATDRLPQPTDLDCAHWLQMDVAEPVHDAEAARGRFDQIRLWLDGHGLHALVNNAATQILGGVDSLSRDDWYQTLDVNLLAPFFWMQALLPELVTAGGSVVNVSSIHARLTKPNFVAYATSKAALSGMTRALAQDLGGRVRVNAIEPAAIATPMLKAGFASQPERYAQLESFHPAGRIGTPKEVASCALWLASDQAGFLHGACIAPDGGIGASLHDPA